MTSDGARPASVPAGEAAPSPVGPGADGPQRLRLRRATDALLALPWDLPLASWRIDQAVFRDLPVGPSRHLVRFVVVDGRIVALKEEPLEVAVHEYTTLRAMEDLAVPAVVATGLAESLERRTAILVTEYLPHSLQYRRLLMRMPGASRRTRSRLLDAMASLLVDLHLRGVYWGDCSLANTLFRRDGTRIQAYLVDAETSEIHPALSDGQRAWDLEVLVENVAFGLADLAAFLGRTADDDDPIEAAESVRTRYDRLWLELHREDHVAPGDRHAVRRRIRTLNDLGFAVDEVELAPAGTGEHVRLRVAVGNHRYHAERLQRRTGIVALEDQARLLLNDLREYGAWLRWSAGREVSDDESAERWRSEVLEPTLSRLAAGIGAERDPLQAYCDLLEHKWLLSEQAGKDVGLEAALASYLALGAPAPEAGGIGPDLESDEATAPGRRSSPERTAPPATAVPARTPSPARAPAEPAAPGVAPDAGPMAGPMSADDDPTAPDR